MPITALQQRASIGEFQSRSCGRRNETGPSLATAAGSLDIDESFRFATRIARSDNAGPATGTSFAQPQRAVATSIQLLLLLGNLRYADNPGAGMQGTPLASSAAATASPPDGMLPAAVSPASWSGLFDMTATALDEAGAFLARHDPLTFPAAAATSLSSYRRPAAGRKHEIRDSDFKRDYLFNRLTFSALTKWATPVDRNDQPLAPEFMFFEQPSGQRQPGPGEAHGQLDAHFQTVLQQYIDTGCHVRARTNEGDVVAELMLVPGATLREIVGEAAERQFGRTGIEAQPWLRRFLRDPGPFNVVMGLSDMNASPLILEAAAKALASTAEGNSGCPKQGLTREDLADFMAGAEAALAGRIAVARDATGIGECDFPSEGESRPDGLFVQENARNGIAVVKHLMVRHHGRDYEIEQDAASRYRAVEREGANATGASREVFHAGNRVHFNRLPGPGLDYEVVDGKAFIQVRGRNHPVFWSENGAPGVETCDPCGKPIRQAVYREPLSRTWHLSKHRGRQVFSPAQRKILEAIGVDGEARLQAYEWVSSGNPKYSGTRDIINVLDGDLQGRFIEIGGRYAPVRAAPQIGSFDVRHEIYDAKSPEKNGYPVMHDGDRWLFEPWSIVSAELAREISPDMFAKGINASMLSAPDSDGYRVDEAGDWYVKARGHFVKVVLKHDGEYLSGGGREIPLE